MTYVQLQNAVIANAFDETDRSDVKNWIQFRYAWLWDAEEWTFRFPAPVTVTFTSGSQLVASVPSDLRHALALYTAQGDPITPIRDHRDFFDLYNANLQNGSSTPEAFTVVGNTLYVGPAGDGTSGLLTYEKSKPSLSADSDTTGLPDGYDLALVHGAKAEGFKLFNVPLWQGFDEDFTAALNAMRRNYLTSIRGDARQFGAYRPQPAQWR